MGAQLCGMVLASDWFGGLEAEDKSLLRGGLFLYGGVYDLRPLLRTSMGKDVRGPRVKKKVYIEKRCHFEMLGNFHP